MHEGILVALGIVIGGVPAMILAVREFFRGRHKDIQEARSGLLHERDNTISHLESQIERLERQIERLENQITRHEAQAEAQQKVINRIDRKLSVCRNDQVRSRLYMEALVGYASRLTHKLQDQGIPFEPLPELPPFLKTERAEGDDSEEDFEARTLETSANILSNVDAKLKEQLRQPPEQ